MKVGEDQRFAYQLYLGGHLGSGAELGVMAKRLAIADEMVVPVTDALFTVFKRDVESGRTRFKGIPGSGLRYPRPLSVWTPFWLNGV